MDYLVYILAILVIGMVTILVVRFATRSRNPDLLLHYEARKKAVARNVEKAQAKIKATDANGNSVVAVKSLRQRHYEKHPHNRTPWGWPGAAKNLDEPQGFSQTLRQFTDRLVRQKQQVKGNGNSSKESIRALLEDRYGRVDRGMTEIPYQKVKRPLLRDPSEMHDQLDNLGSAETRQLRKKLQLLAAMEAGTESGNEKTEPRKTRNADFRYVELKDIKQPWGW